MKKIAYITDIHLDEQFISDNGIDARSNWEIILNDIRSRNINEIIFGGDIGERSANEWFFGTMRDFTVNITLGNHDYFSEAIQHFKSDHLQGYDELYYSFDDGAFRYVFLDSSSHSVNPEQRMWLQRQVNTEKIILLFLHHPIIPVPTNLERYWPLKGREQLRVILQQHRNEITVFCGHFHTWDIQQDGNITQIMTPAASYQTKKLGARGDIPGFSRAYATPDGGSTWNPLDLIEEKVNHLDETILVINNTTFGYRIITVDDSKISTELLLYKDNCFQVTSEAF